MLIANLRIAWGMLPHLLREIPRRARKDNAMLLLCHVPSSLSYSPQGELPAYQRCMGGLPSNGAVVALPEDAGWGASSLSG